MSGRFIVFEGIDSGVISEQTRLMAEYLRSEGLRVIPAREPTDGPIGAQIRLIRDGRLVMHDLAQAVLFLVDRMDHLYQKNTGILAELDKGNYVVCTRYLLSAFAYQSSSATLDWLMQINETCPWPDLMIFVDTPLQSSLDRLVRQEGYDVNMLEQKQSELEKTRAGYLHSIEQCQARGWKTASIDGNQTQNAIHRSCRKLVQRLGVEE